MPLTPGQAQAKGKDETKYSAKTLGLLKVERP